MKPGEKYWYVPSEMYARAAFEPCWVEIAKVGRVWAETTQPFKFPRFHVNTMKAGDLTGGGRLYTSPEAHAEAVKIRKAWHDTIGRLTQHSPPEHLTYAQILEVRAVIFPNKKDWQT